MPDARLNAQPNLDRGTNHDFRIDVTGTAGGIDAKSRPHRRDR